LAQLAEESQDLHVDAMRGTHAALAEVVEIGHQAPAPPYDRRRFLRRSIFAAGAMVGAGGGSTLGRLTTTVLADAGADVQMLQTAASLENLAVAVYTNPTAQQLVGATGNPVLVAFVTKTVEQHTDHARAFNAAAMALAGKGQVNIDKVVYETVVTPALSRITGPTGVLELAITLEDAAAQTYVKFAGDARDERALGPLASIAPVEAQHAAVLRTVKAILDAGAPMEAIALPPDLAAIPPGAISDAAGAAGFPKSFHPTDAARPAGEGAVP